MNKKSNMSVLFAIAFIFLIMIIFVAYTFCTMDSTNGQYYTNTDFGIDDYISNVDMDGDGVDDQTDILQNTREYIATKPKYKSEYYQTGYPTGEYGVCTDVVGYALKNSGYDLMTLVNEDITKNTKDYDIEKIDINIDFRRVKNLRVYFEKNAISLTTDIHKTDQWQGGDIIIFEDHIGIVSDKRNENGVPYIIHHAYAGQRNYEEDVLESGLPSYTNITGHYRVS